MYPLKQNDDVLKGLTLMVLLSLECVLVTVSGRAHSTHRLEDRHFVLLRSTTWAEAHAPSQTGRQGLRLRNLLIIDVKAVR